MNHVNQTLYIPLYGKSYVSKKGLFLEEKKLRKSGMRKVFPFMGNQSPNGLLTIWEFVLPYLMNG